MMIASNWPVALNKKWLYLTVIFVFYAAIRGAHTNTTYHFCLEFRNEWENVVMCWRILFSDRFYQNFKKIQ